MFYNPVKKDTARVVQLLQPLIEERQRAAAELGEGWNDKPVSGGHKPYAVCCLVTHRLAKNDLLQFLLEKATPKNESVFVIAQRLLSLNFAGIHTTSNVRHGGSIFSV